VLVVWLPMLLGDSRVTTDNRLLADKRVLNYWDSQQAAGRWFARNVEQRPGIAWDEYFLYGPEATWDAEPAPLLSQGGSVIAASGELETAIRPFLA
jgi:hypothetical protein